MIGDDDANGSATPDPWDEIVADSLDAESLDADGGGLAFDLGEAALGSQSDAGSTPGLPPQDDAFDDPGLAPVESLDAEAPGAEAGDIDEEALVEGWLSEDDEATESPALSVYPADEAAAGASGIDAGTETSGLGLHAAFNDDDHDADSFAATPAGESDAVAWSGVESADGESAAVDMVGFPAGVAGAVGAAVAAAAPTGKAGRGTKKKSSGLGQLVGIVLGGLMAIPITLAILIYGLGQDPFGVTKRLPAEVAFLLPERFRPEFTAPAAIAAAQPDAAPSLDDLPVEPAPSVEPPVASESESAAEPAVEPAVVADETAVPAEPADVPDAGLAAMPPESPPESVPGSDAVPMAEPEADELPMEVPSLDALAASAVPAIPIEPAAEPEPLDTAALDEAAGEASALSAALGVVEDRGNRGYRLLRTRWYRALARMAEELVAVENAALTSGRPLAAAPDSVVELHGAIEASDPLVAELAALAPDWLAYAKRGSDGVVLPATFASARKVGPLWVARVALTGADGVPIDLTVISRNEPTAASGERVVVTGVAVGETVVWAADIRGAGTVRADAADAFEPSSGF